MKIEIPKVVASEARENDQVHYRAGVSEIEFYSNGITGKLHAHRYELGSVSIDTTLWSGRDIEEDVRICFANIGYLVPRLVLVELLRPFRAECERLSREYERAS